MANKNKKIKLGIPKGSLQESTLKVFKLAGFNIEILPKSYIPKIDDPEIECFLLRPQEIPKYIEEGRLDIGISGDDWIAETRAKVVEVCDLRYAKQKIKKVKWVLAVDRNSKIKSLKNLNGKTISTEIVNLAKDFLKKNKINAEIKFSWGATEVKPPRFADAIIDLVETGGALKAHNLKILDTVFESSTKLITNKEALDNLWKKEKMESLAVVLKGAVESEKKMGVFLHVPKEKIEKILKSLPAQEPTVKRIAGTDLYDIFFIGDEKGNKELIPQLKRMGCQDIIEFPLNKVVV